MRFFMMACMFCLLIASVGCMTNNWSSPLFGKTGIGQDAEIYRDLVEDKKPKPGFWTSKFGEGSGLDPRAQEIEKRLGL
jgi:hypothetical protein